MKKIGLILAVCLAYIGLYGAHADDAGDIARAAVRRGTNTATSVTRQKNDTPAVTTRPSGNKSSTISSRTATQNTRTTSTLNRNKTDDTQSASVVARTPTSSVVARTGTTVTEPKKTLTRTATTTPQKASVARTTTTRTTGRVAKTTATREDILQRDFSKCKTVFYECMDEFCANKDTQLKRCACSARSTEFDSVKKQLENIDDKMLDFNQRLLTVNMDREDAAALNVATEGEKAFYDTKDVSASKKTLDSIAKKLNTSFDSSNFSNSLGTVFSWSLDIDSAFDNVDSLQGASTVAKSGTALYSAALPVCREMAAEVCSDTDLSLAESGYQLTIEQDCNTVAKTYKSQIDTARTKVLESGALLDISRLDIYQKRNADDLLTCKKKMLAMLTDSTVCGDDMGKCLDITGQYIDPTTGEAFLSTELADLNNLILRPTGTEKWTEVRQNEPFVTFLNSKKKFLEPAMENCQNIADTVWDAFLDDALAQIKIAQSKKLSQVIQSCTTLTAQCLNNAADSIIEFDSRALSIFGVTADTTQNAMCDDILTSCTALLETIGDENLQWYTGITGIQTDITFETIKNTCREVGRACIIQTCTSTSGNFGLCENIDTSVNRKTIVNGSACWDEVLNCVKSAGDSAISAIFDQNKLYKNYALYKSVYPNLYNKKITFTNVANASTCINSDQSEQCIYDLCWNQCAPTDSETGDQTAADHYYADSNECRACRIAENIWGNCEARPTEPLSSSGAHNQIKISSNTTSPTTLLHWFAVNTGTQNAADSCRDTTCGVGFISITDPITGGIACVDSNDTDSFGNPCRTPIITANGNTQCCNTGKKDSSGNCCTTGNPKKISNYDVCTRDTTIKLVGSFKITLDQATSQYPVGNYYLVCDGTMSYEDDTPTCSGHFILIRVSPSVRTSTIHYTSPVNSNDITETFSIPGDTPEQSKTYIWKYQNGAWGWYDENDSNSDNIKPTNWMVNFGGNQNENP